MARQLFLLTVIWLAASAGGTNATAQDQFLGRTLDQWRAECAEQGQARVHAAWAISQFAGRTVADVTKLTDDRDPAVRYWGVSGLLSYARGQSASGGEQRVVATLEALLNDKSPAPRIAAAEALLLLGKNERALEVLLAAMSDPQESTRIQAVAALEKVGPIPSLEPALRAGAKDSSEYVKRISERALSKFVEKKK